MSSIWMGIAPGPTATRVLAMHGAGETLLKARLRRDPSHPRALATLLEAIALWQGMHVHAALAADDERTSCDSSLCRDRLTDHGIDPLFTVAWVPVAGRRRRRPGIAGMGRFHDLERLLIGEVSR
ncbi:hypothetical protein [Sorangium sp. So ce362]|uniref:hypothetical protein n=1 Tax=Sorangium sp. So ce362 TaxID=3133303 RepID=UPI003F5EBFED